MLIINFHLCGKRLKAGQPSCKLEGGEQIADRKSLEEVQEGQAAFMASFLVEDATSL